MKIYRVSMALISGALLILSFQNCSDFSLQEQILYEQGVIDSRNALDAKLLPELLSSPQLSKWYKQEDPIFVDGALMANQWSVVVAVDRTITGEFMRVDSSGDEVGSISVSGGKIKAERSSTMASYSEYLEASLPASGDKMVVGVSFGKAGDIKLMVNGIMQKGELAVTGTPTDFTYIAKTVSAVPNGSTIYEYVVFGGSSLTSATDGLLSYSGLNVMSRYLADNQVIPNVAYDVNLINDGGSGGTTGPSPEFLAAKAVIDANCMACHSGIASPNLSGMTQSRAISSGWIKPKDLASSPLYFWLQGATVAGPKTMPKNSAAMSAGDVQKIADWIMSIQ